VCRMHSRKVSNVQDERAKLAHIFAHPSPPSCACRTLLAPVLLERVCQLLTDSKGDPTLLGAAS
jgi:hypothetical protein